MLRYPRVIALLIILLTCAVYFPSLSVPFYLDDFSSLVDNPVLQEPSWSALHQNYPLRELGYATFALNETVFDGEQSSYHVINIIIHILAGTGVYALSLQLCKLIGFNNERTIVFSLFAFGLFLLLPLNTQAVTYIVQRLASLVTVFYVWGLVLYLVARQLNGFPRYFYYALVVLFFIAGMLTKQNMATFPAAIVLLELFLIRSWFHDNFSKLLFAVMAASICLFITDLVFELTLISTLDAFLVAGSSLSRFDYFTHQLVIVWVYIFKFFIPFPLLLEYSPVPLDWSNWQVWLAATGHSLVIALAFKLRKIHPLVTLSIALYYLFHSVESAFIPIADLAFEHRAYLPNVALCLLFAYLVSSVDWLSKKEIRITSIFVIVLTLCAFVSYKRNILWQTPMKFLQHELTHTVDNSRVYASVAALFAEQGNLRQADSWFKASIQVAEETGFLQADTLINYLKLLYQQNKMAGALRFSGMALKVIKEDQYKSQIKTILARFYVDRGECEFATGMLRQALKLDPSNSLADELLSRCRSGN